MYLGRHDWFDLTSNYSDHGYQRYLKKTKLHIFVSTDGQSNYWTQTGFTKLAAKVGDDPAPTYADELDKFTNSIHGSEPVELVGKRQNFPSTERWGYSCYYKKGNDYYPISF